MCGRAFLSCGRPVGVSVVVVVVHDVVVVVVVVIAFVVLVLVDQSTSTTATSVLCPCFIVSEERAFFSGRSRGRVDLVPGRRRVGRGTPLSHLSPFCVCVCACTLSVGKQGKSGIS